MSDASGFEGAHPGAGRAGTGAGAARAIGDEDVRLAWGGREPLAPGSVVAHFKREALPPEELAAGSTRYLYRFLGVARHSETQEPLALYEALYPPFGLWARPLAMFAGEVDRARYPEARQRWRFEEV